MLELTDLNAPLRHKIRQHWEELKPHWGKIMALSPLFFLIFFGYVLSTVTASVLFVERVGIEYLPFIYVVGALLIVLAGLAITSFTEKKSIARVLLTLVGFGLAVFMELYWVIKFENTWAYSFFLLFSQTLYLLLSGTLIWNLAVKLCSPFEAKKNFIYYSIGASLGGITAGLLPTFLGIHFSTENYVLILIGALFLAALNLLYLERRYKVLLLPEVELEKTFKTDYLRRGFKSFKNIRIVKLLFATLTLFYSISWIADFELQKILSENFEEGRFAELYGLTAFAQSTLLVAVLLFLESSLVKRFGVLNVLLSTPFILVPAFVALLFFPTPAVVITAALLTNVVTYSLFINSSNFVFTALPHNLRNQVSTFIRANADAAAMLSAGAGLLVISQFLSNQWIVVATLLILLDVAVILYYLRAEYLKQIIQNLNSENKEDMHTAIENFGERVYRKVGVQELMKLISWKKMDAETVRKVIFTLSKIDNIQVIPALLDIFNQYDNTVKYSVVESIHSFTHLKKRLEELPFTRQNVLDSYKKVFLDEEDAELIILILDGLKDFDPDDVIVFLKNGMASKNTLLKYQSIKAMKYFHDRGIVRYVKPFLKDPHPMLQAGSIIALWQFTEMRPQLLKTFVDMMSKRKKESILAALLIMSKLQIKWEVPFAKKHLLSKNKEIRVMAALTLLELDNAEGMRDIVDVLTKKTPYSLIAARNIKSFSPQIANTLFQEIGKRDAASVETCIEILKSSYLNFTEEIDALTKKGKQDLQRLALRKYSGV